MQLLAFSQTPPAPHKLSDVALRGTGEEETRRLAPSTHSYPPIPDPKNKQLSALQMCLQPIKHPYCPYSQHPTTIFLHPTPSGSPVLTLCFTLVLKNLGSVWRTGIQTEFIYLLLLLVETRAQKMTELKSEHWVDGEPKGQPCSAEWCWLVAKWVCGCKTLGVCLCVWEKAS